MMKTALHDAKHHRSPKAFGVSAAPNESQFAVQRMAMRKVIHSPKPDRSSKAFCVTGYTKKYRPNDRTNSENGKIMANDSQNHESLCSTLEQSEASFEVERKA